MNLISLKRRSVAQSRTNTTENRSQRILSSWILVLSSSLISFRPLLIKEKLKRTAFFFGFDIGTSLSSDMLSFLGLVEIGKKPQIEKKFRGDWQLYTVRNKKVSIKAMNRWWEMNDWGSGHSEILLFGIFKVGTWNHASSYGKWKTRDGLTQPNPTQPPLNRVRCACVQCVYIIGPTDYMDLCDSLSKVAHSFLLQMTIFPLILNMLGSRGDNPPETRRNSWNLGQKRAGKTGGTLELLIYT